MATINTKKPEIIFKILGTKSRLDILRLLEANTEMSILDIAKKLKIAHQTATEHLRLMRDVGMLEERKESYYMMYRITDKMLKVIQEMKLKDLIYG
jgi:DNA-binding transcriptional ArsR family regulator